MFGEWTKVVKINEKMKSTRYFFKSSRIKHQYAPKKSLKRKSFSKEQTQRTILAHRKLRKQLLKKRVTLLFIALFVLICLLYLIDKRILF